MVLKKLNKKINNNHIYIHSFLKVMIFSYLYTFLAPVKKLTLKKARENYNVHTILISAP